MEIMEAARKCELIYQKIWKFEEEEEKTVEMIIEMLEIVEEDKLDNENIKRVIESSLNSGIVTDLMNRELVRIYKGTIQELFRKCEEELERKAKERESKEESVNNEREEDKVALNGNIEDGKFECKKCGTQMRSKEEYFEHIRKRHVEY